MICESHEVRQVGLTIVAALHTAYGEGQKTVVGVVGEQPVDSLRIGCVTRLRRPAPGSRAEFPRCGRLPDRRCSSHSINGVAEFLFAGHKSDSPVLSSTDSRDAGYSARFPMEGECLFAQRHPVAVRHHGDCHHQTS